MNNEIEVLNGLVGALVKAKDLIDNHSQTEIEILKEKCDKESKSILSAYNAIEEFFTEHWNELQGDRLNGGIWKNDYLCGSPMYFGGHIKLVTLEKNNFVKVVGVTLDCDSKYSLKKRTKMPFNTSHPTSDPHSVTTIDYWTEEWEALKWDRMVLEETITFIKKELTRLVNSQFERNNRAKEAINDNKDKIVITIEF